MKVVACVVLIGALACLLHETSAQQNWWERDDDGAAVIATSRRPATTRRPASTANSGSTVSTTAAPATSSTTPCPCPVTPEYNPVCGDDKLTYTNPGMLQCAANCGKNVRILFHGRCEKLA